MLVRRLITALFTIILVLLPLYSPTFSMGTSMQLNTLTSPDPSISPDYEGKSNSAAAANATAALCSPVHTPTNGNYVPGFVAPGCGPVDTRFHFQLVYGDALIVFHIDGTINGKPANWTCKGQCDVSVHDGGGTVVMGARDPVTGGGFGDAWTLVPTLCIAPNGHKWIYWNQPCPTTTTNSPTPHTPSHHSSPTPTPSPSPASSPFDDGARTIYGVSGSFYDCQHSVTCHGNDLGYDAAAFNLDAGFIRVQQLMPCYHHDKMTHKILDAAWRQSDADVQAALGFSTRQGKYRNLIPVVNFVSQCTLVKGSDKSNVLTPEDWHYALANYAANLKQLLVSMKIKSMSVYFEIGNEMNGSLEKGKYGIYYQSIFYAAATALNSVLIATKKVHYYRILTGAWVAPTGATGVLTLKGSPQSCRLWGRNDYTHKIVQVLGSYPRYAYDLTITQQAIHEAESGKSFPDSVPLPGKYGTVTSNHLGIALHPYGYVTPNHSEWPNFLFREKNGGGRGVGSPCNTLGYVNATWIDAFPGQHLPLVYTEVNYSSNDQLPPNFKIVYHRCPNTPGRVDGYSQCYYLGKNYRDTEYQYKNPCIRGHSGDRSSWSTYCPDNQAQGSYVVDLMSYLNTHLPCPDVRHLCTSNPSDGSNAARTPLRVMWYKGDDDAPEDADIRKRGFLGLYLDGSEFDKSRRVPRGFLQYDKIVSLICPHGARFNLTTTSVAAVFRQLQKRSCLQSFPLHPSLTADLNVSNSRGRNETRLTVQGSGFVTNEPILFQWSCKPSSFSSCTHRYTWKLPCVTTTAPDLNQRAPHGCVTANAPITNSTANTVPGSFKRSFTISGLIPAGQYEITAFGQISGLVASSPTLTQRPFQPPHQASISLDRKIVHLNPQNLTTIHVTGRYFPRNSPVQIFLYDCAPYSHSGCAHAHNRPLTKQGQYKARTGGSFTIPITIPVGTKDGKYSIVVRYKGGSDVASIAGRTSNAAIGSSGEVTVPIDVRSPVSAILSLQPSHGYAGLEHPCAR